MLVLEDAPIVMSAEGFIDLLFGVFAVYLLPFSKSFIISPFKNAYRAQTIYALDDMAC